MKKLYLNYKQFKVGESNGWTTQEKAMALILVLRDNALEKGNSNQHEKLVIVVII